MGELVTRSQKSAKLWMAYNNKEGSGTNSGRMEVGGSRDLPGHRQSHAGRL